MTVAEYMLEGNDLRNLNFGTVTFVRHTLNGDRVASARFEGLNGDGNAVCRYNGKSESDWYLPRILDPSEVTVVLKDGRPVLYDARPLTG